MDKVGFYTSVNGDDAEDDTERPVHCGVEAYKEEGVNERADADCLIGIGVERRELLKFDRTNDIGDPLNYRRDDEDDPVPKL